MDGGELGHFSLLEKIGEGGMGRVYKARDKRLDRFVAIKLLPESRNTDPDRRARFVQEAKAASALNHPNIITIHEIGEQDGQTYIVMELVDGKALNELIPRKGMRLTEALRIAAQVADALTAAHAAGIVHRDLKPANIMVDAHGRAKVLDFGLAKLAAPAAASGADEATHTLAMDRPVSEEGVIVGSVPYMSPEQAEGKPVDARSDIFSFGAVLYEMVTGQRAFRGESKISTLAAIVEKDPPPAGEISSSTPPELERVIARCLRKDVNRRSQNMADVKLALEELWDESESGKLARPAAIADARTRRWLWPSVAMACALIAAGAFVWVYFNFRGSQAKGPDLVRLSPEDGHSYNEPTISPDGGFVAYVSDRSGKDELWLQQVGSGDPIQLTHANESVEDPAFFPDGKRILYARIPADQTKSTIETISTLGGEPKVLIQGKNSRPKLSPDGRQIAYFDNNQGSGRLMAISSDGGRPRELPAWARMPDALGVAAWTPDSRYLLSMARKSGATGGEGFEWFALPVDGGNPVPTGAGAVLRAAGLAMGIPILMTGDRVLFLGATPGRKNVWEIRLSPGSWRVQGVARQLTFGTLSESPGSVSGTGTAALSVGSYLEDFYLIPLSAATGQPTGVSRRLTQDGRSKNLRWYTGGDPGSAYFGVFTGTAQSIYAVDLETWKQTFVGAGLHLSEISPDGRQVAYSVPEGDSYTIRVGDAGAGLAESRVLCKACGLVNTFSPDGRFIFHDGGAKVKADPKRKLTVRLLEVASGKDRLWLEHPTDSVFVAKTFGRDSGWLWIVLSPPGSPWSRRRYLVPWREEAAPQPEWIRIPLPDGTGWSPPWRISTTGNIFYLFEGSKLMAVRFDPKTGGFSEHYEVKFVPGSAVTLKPDDDWTVRGPGLVFSRWEGGSSVWLMKLPH
jgi:eukaryotic-like serine/threonine-protein kinase